MDDETTTRDRVCRTVAERGPITAAELAALLGMTATAVRKHLDTLTEHDLVTPFDTAPSRQRGRGRPARQFVATERGQTALGNEYGDLAAEALRYLAEVAGAPAVRAFADRRIALLEARVRPAVEAAGDDVEGRARALADALTGDGYAATSRPVHLGTTPVGVQLCQGHCPVHDVAREFPQLCEAETDAFSRLLGVHVQRLATMAHGEHVCTTHVPVTRSPERQPR